MIRLRPQNVRTRLTIWYVGVLAGILALYVGGSSSFLFFNLRRELDHSLIEDIEATEGLLRFAPDGKLILSGTHTEPGEEPDQGRLLEILTPQGGLLYHSTPLGARSLGGAPFPSEGKQGYSERSATFTDGSRIRLASRYHMVGDRPVVIRLARSEEPLWGEFWHLLTVLLVGLPVALGIAGLGGYGLAVRALLPLENMARRAEKINAENLGDRLPVENPQDELGHLARVFNDALARLERSFEQLRRFTADASHELRTPLTAIRTVGEVGLQQDGDTWHYRDVIGSMLEEANGLTRLVDSLLTISRADSGHIQLNRTTFALLTAAREATTLMEVLAEEKGQRLTVEGDRIVAVYADRVIVRQAIVNLIDNAVKYSPRGGTISVRVALSRNAAAVEVQDSGPGIPAEHREHVFERFYRVDKGRSRESGGAGLGLAIVKWAVEAHGGEVTLACGANGGCTFAMTFPVSTSDEVSRQLPEATERTSQ
jgi:heavy metal sensor kinase